MRAILVLAPVVLAVQVTTATVPLTAQERPAELTGCYDITGELPHYGVGSGFHSEVPTRIEFAGPFRGWSDGDTLRTAIVVPEGALPSTHSSMSGEIVGDSLNVRFSTGFAGVTATLGWTGDRWVGIARDFADFRLDLVEIGPIELTPVSCDSPPPVSIDAMLPITRSVELEGGLAITLGEPLPDALETTPAIGSMLTVTGARPTGLFAGAGSVAVALRRRVTHIWLYYTDSSAYSDVTARLQRAYGAPEEHHSGYAHFFSNPITLLMMDDLGNSQGRIVLMDRR